MIMITTIETRTPERRKRERKKKKEFVRFTHGLGVI